MGQQQMQMQMDAMKQEAWRSRWWQEYLDQVANGAIVPDQLDQEQAMMGY